MNRLAIALLLVAGSAGMAAADGWIDCNGPDKNGRGCQTADVNALSTGIALAVVGLVALRIRKPRRATLADTAGVEDGDDRDR